MVLILLTSLFRIVTAIIMGFFITSLVATILTVAGLLTTHNWTKSQTSYTNKFTGIPHRKYPQVLYELKSPYDTFSKRSSGSRVAREDYLDGGYYGGAIEKSDFYYVLPILLVIGLGSFLIPIISTFFTALVTSSSAIGGCCGRRKRRRRANQSLISIDTIYEIWQTVQKAIDKLGTNFDNE